MNLILASMTIPVSVACTLVGLGILLGAARLMLGPTLADRVVALDLMGVLGVGLMAAYAVGADLPVLLDVALVVGLVAFLATVAFARWYLEKGAPQ